MSNYLRGPMNSNYGYEPHMCAPFAQVAAAAKLSGPAMWTALGQCDWVSCSEVDEDWSLADGSELIGDTSCVDGETLTICAIC
jgi:hypothetical protein